MLLKLPSTLTFIAIDIGNSLLGEQIAVIECVNKFYF